MARSYFNYFEYNFNSKRINFCFENVKVAIYTKNRYVEILAQYKF